jgi:peptidyl-prolyl cis-trans isomerase SurA
MAYIIFPRDAAFRRMRITALPLLAALMVAGISMPAHAQFKRDAAVMPRPAASSQPPATSEPQLVDAIIAVINNEIITQRELLERSRLIESRLAAQGTTMPPRGELQRDVLEQMIVERAQLQRARELGIRVDDGMLDRAVARIAEQNNLSMADFRTQLDREGVPFPKFREDIRREITQQRLREREVDNKIQVTESEVDNFLAAAGVGPQATPQQELNVSQILVRVPEGATPEEVTQRRKRAEEIRAQLAGGADFTQVSASMSDAPDAATGGSLGWRTPDRLPQLFIDAIAGVEQGQVSPIVRSPNGFHVLRLNERRAFDQKAALPSVEQTRARHILIKVNQLVSPADARRKLTEVKERLDNKSTTFEELARLYSNDLSASKGGDLGWIYPGDTVPEFERAMNALQPGEISEPVESPFGLHLIQVLERKTDDVSPERQRLVARQQIRERKIQEATQDWLRQLRDSTYVEYRFPDNG